MICALNQSEYYKYYLNNILIIKHYLDNIYFIRTDLNVQIITLFFNNSIEGHLRELWLKKTWKIKHMEDLG